MPALALTVTYTNLNRLHFRLVCGNFDIIFGPFLIILGHFSRISRRRPHPTHAVCCAQLGARADLVLIGAWNPML